MKRSRTILIVVFCSLILTLSKAQNISTVAGDHSYGYSGDGGPATAAELYFPNKVAFDVTGNIYIVEAMNNVIRKVNSSGVISTIAGNGYLAGTGHGYYSGDGGPATAAELSCPTGIVIDNTGNIYFADFHNYIVRKINTSGIISTIAGNHSYGNSGDGGPATAAEFTYPYGLALDASGNLYISDCNNGAVRKVNTSGIITDFAGKTRYYVGYTGDGGPATNAELNTPSGLCFDGSGNLYIADNGNTAIRKVDTSGIISTFAGGHGWNGHSGDGGPAIAAEFSSPNDVSADASGNIYVADYQTNVVRMVNSSGIINRVAGNYTYGYSGDGGPATLAELYEPMGVSLDILGNIYIADAVNNVIRKVSMPTGIEEIREGNGVSVYPNPCNGTFTISNITEKCNIEIYNILGEKVYSETLQSQDNNIINLAGQSNGMYLYRVFKEGGELLVNGKLVIEK